MQSMRRPYRRCQANGVTEGPMLEFKRDAYGGSDDARKEFLKDVSSLANTMGGHLIIGIDELEGAAGALVPLSGDIDAEQLRLENLLRDGLQPRIVGLRMRAIAVNGGSVIVIRVPRSLNAPHRVGFKGSNKFHARNSAGAYELGVDELRVAFTAQATSRERAAAFRAERLALIAAGEAPMELNLADGAVVMHIVPFSAFSGGSVNVEVPHSESAFAPIDAHGYSPRLNFEGYICKERDIAYTQLFRNGAVEAVMSGVASENNNGKRVISGPWFEEKLIRSLASYLPWLTRLEVAPPALIGISFVNIAGAAIHIGSDFSSYRSANPTPVRQDRLDLPAVIIDNWDPVPELRATLRQAFDALWNAAGASRGHMFDENGAYVGERRG